MPLDLTSLVSNSDAIRAFELENETPEQTAARLLREAEFAAMVALSDKAHDMPKKDAVIP